VPTAQSHAHVPLLLPGRGWHGRPLAVPIRSRPNHGLGSCGLPFRRSMRCRGRKCGNAPDAARAHSGCDRRIRSRYWPGCVAHGIADYRTLNAPGSLPRRPGPQGSRPPRVPISLSRRAWPVRVPHHVCRIVPAPDRRPWSTPPGPPPSPDPKAHPLPIIAYSSLPDSGWRENHWKVGGTKDNPAQCPQRPPNRAATGETRPRRTVTVSGVRAKASTGRAAATGFQIASPEVAFSQRYASSPIYLQESGSPHVGESKPPPQPRPGADGDAG
jgi:hypothetical protein